MTQRDGDGSALRPMHGWQVVHRTVFGIAHAGERWVVDVDLIDDTAALYRGGVQVARSSLPARFPIGDATIEVAATTFGLRRAHLVHADGGERQLDPAPGTAERWRAVLDHRWPVLSRVIAVVAVLVLIVGLGVAGAEAWEWLTSIEAIGERVGVFASPLALPEWAVTTLTVAGLLAALERALTLRHHWLLDADTFWV